VCPAAGSDAFCVYLPCMHHHPASPEADMLGRSGTGTGRLIVGEPKEPSSREIADAKPRHEFWVTLSITTGWVDDAQSTQS
jgi:hypothetical protein